MNGREAIEFLQRQVDKRLPDIIVLDLSMPVMDGFAFLEAFGKIDLPGKKAITIIVLTASIDSRDRVGATNLGVHHYLIKPVDERELRSCNQ